LSTIAGASDRNCYLAATGEGTSPSSPLEALLRGVTIERFGEPFDGCVPAKTYTQPAPAGPRRFFEAQSEHLTQQSTKAIMPEDQNTDIPPNHLSIDPRSAFYSEEALRRDVGIRFNGTEKTNVHEYNVAEGWVRVEVPTAKDRRGNPMVVKLSGTVEPYYR
jgi:hypothetical protein